MKPFIDAFAQDLSSLRSESPLVLNLTNFVAMDLTANALLALGASPVMAHAEEEMRELISAAGAVVINIGTLDPQMVTRMQLASKLASAAGKPLVLDPVGAGATTYRTQTARALLAEHRFAVVRSNASEMAAVFAAPESAGTDAKGVDSVLDSSAVKDFALRVSKETECALWVSGEIDYVLHLGRCVALKNGSPLMAKVTAMGCTATSLTAAFLAVNPDPFQATFNAAAVMGLCGDEARRRSATPGTFRSAFVDALAQVESSWASRLEVVFS